MIALLRMREKASVFYFLLALAHSIMVECPPNKGYFSTSLGNTCLTPIYFTLYETLLFLLHSTPALPDVCFCLQR